MSHLFWLSNQQWAVIAPYFPNKQPDARRVDDRRVTSGVIHILKSACRWGDCPAEYSPETTIHNHFNRYASVSELIW